MQIVRNNADPKVIELIEFNASDLRKGVDPEADHIQATDLQYVQAMDYLKAKSVVYWSPSGKRITLKGQDG